MKESLLVFFKKFNLSVVAILVFCFLYFQKPLNEFIENYLMADPKYNSLYLKTLIFVAFASILYILYVKLCKSRYRPSATEYFLISTLCFVLLCYRLNYNSLNWNLHNIFESAYYNVRYLDLALLLIATYYAFNIIDFYSSPNISREINNDIISDDPLTAQQIDLLEHTATAERLTKILLNEQHRKSISIGLIGPWGNGKSSVIEKVKAKIETSDEYLANDIISIHFLPYLNHNENDIINEFFTSLSNEMATYNGKLSNKLIDYSQKLTDLYQNKSISGFVENQITNFSKISANELYQTIDTMLGEVGKKIIIFIDDLDRLNQNEILQTLKLIRNTANFRNTFFVVAMDKEYVIKRLTDKGNILDTKFVDKFFQLEVHLPEIDNAVLKKYFIAELLKPFYTSAIPADFQNRFLAAVNSPYLLFENYIRNFRDAKRAINQIKFDLSLYKEDFSYLNLKDFMNFTFLKLKFPSITKQLNENAGEFLETVDANGTYKLKTIGSPNARSGESINHFLSTTEIDNIDYLKEYKVYHDIIKGKKTIKNMELKINKGDKKLLIKTLAFLFGDQNKIEAQDSIKYINNFQMLVQQRIFTKYFKQSEFERLYQITPESLPNEIAQIENDKKTEQLISRVKFLPIENEDRIKRTIQYMIIIYDTANINNMYDLDNFKLINALVKRLYLATPEEQRPQYTQWINKFIFNNDSIKIDTRLTLLGTLWNIKEFDELWHLEEAQVVTMTVDLYKKYLKAYDNVLWDVTNYQTYGPYHAVKIIDSKQINTALKEFWKRNSIELFCAQATEIESFSNSFFRISDTQNEIFDSKANFVAFIKEHPDHDLAPVAEFIGLYNLLEITGFSPALVYKFTKSTLMQKKIQEYTTYPGRESSLDKKPFPQVIVKLTEIDMGYTFIGTVSDPTKYQVKSYIFGDNIYLKFDIFDPNISQVLSTIIDQLLEQSNDEIPAIFSESAIAENTKIEFDDDNSIEFVSIQAAPNNIPYINNRVSNS